MAIAEGITLFVNHDEIMDFLSEKHGRMSGGEKHEHAEIRKHYRGAYKTGVQYPVGS